MPRDLFKRNCEHCGKNFLTYEKDKVFCKSTCEGRHHYNEMLGKDQPKKTLNYCAHCGDEVHSPQGVSKGNRFCNSICRKEFGKKELILVANARPMKKRGAKRALPYEVLNKIAEKERVFDEKHAFWYIRRGGSYGG